MLSIQLISRYICNSKILEMPHMAALAIKYLPLQGDSIPNVSLQTGADVAGRGVGAVGVTVAVVDRLILSGLCRTLVHWSS